MVHGASFKLVGDESHSSSILPAERRILGSSPVMSSQKLPETYFFNPKTQEKVKSADFFHPHNHVSNFQVMRYTQTFEWKKKQSMWNFVARWKTDNVFLRNARPFNLHYDISRYSLPGQHEFTLAWIVGGIAICILIFWRYFFN